MNIMTASFVLLTAAAGVAKANEACLDFSGHPAERQSGGKIVAPKIDKSNPAYRYRTRIRLEGMGAPNFAGHLRVVTWGCGSGCHEIALVDIETGETWLVEIPPAALGYEYHVDSLLLVSDTASMLPGWVPGDPTAFEFSSESYVWDDERQVLTKLPGCKGTAQQGTPRAAHP
jgi:hypothetical protein